MNLTFLLSQLTGSCNLSEDREQLEPLEDVTEDSLGIDRDEGIESEEGRISSSHKEFPIVDEI